MNCRSCGTANEPARRYCRQCGGRLGRPCPVCLFFNELDDKHCGGCGRRITGGATPVSDTVTEAGALAPAVPADQGYACDDETVTPGAGAALAEQNVSQSEIDGLFENILDEDEGPGEAGA